MNKCFVCYQGDTPCEGKHFDTCFTCIDNICGCTVRAISALKNSHWHSGRCTTCNKFGITIFISLCDYHATERDESSESDKEYECV